MSRPELDFPLDVSPAPRTSGSRPPGVPPAAPPETGVRDDRKRPRRIPLPRPRPRPMAIAVHEPHLPLDIDDFQELRRLGLFGDDGRNPPPSWWAR